ncbi:hypothetical protein DJ568_16780 [Mucilaginibacter hurinus]|uniref:Uncharacterized protein n=1 Tax=Mucilaginibacter hurinus TaxID=2201324 RepID=A0A367GLH4_9SPHI|nr:hypothetical protein DJ568_16780 [Mucilaginibacter hurinus]
MLFVSEINMFPYAAANGSLHHALSRYIPFAVSLAVDLAGNAAKQQPLRQDRFFLAEKKC